MSTEADQRLPLAVIGMAARFPGAGDTTEYWHNVRAGTDSAAARGTTARTPTDHVDAGGRLDGIDLFDAGFFGMTPREARLTDPQHRLFLETSYHALEDAGYTSEPPGTRIGVFAGSGMNLYPQRSYLLTQLHGAGDDPVTGVQTAIGNQPDFLSSRVAFRLGLTGPAVSVQTACSTSLVALHTAAQALRNGDAGMALVGAAAVHVPQDAGYRYTEGSILSASGVCRPFSADADGTVGGSGVAAVVVKPLEAARADGAPVHAIVLGTAVNNDGAAKVGYTAPSVAGQAAVVRSALDRAGVHPDTVGYVEAHGTGTALGDPIEVQGLARAFGSGDDRAAPCELGSVKANIGHLDSCAGMAGLVKAVLVLKHGVVPGQINVNGINPELRLAETPFRISESTHPWPESSRPRRAGVCSLGVGGTNAHVVLEEPPAPEPEPEWDGPGVLPLSAHTPEALTERAEQYRDRLRGGGAPGGLLLSAAGASRPMHHRIAATGSSASELADALDGFVTARPDTTAALPGGVVSSTGDGAANERFVFLYPGQGNHAPGMARTLYHRYPAFRAVVDECDSHHARTWDESLTSALVGGEGPEAWTTDLLQPALFTYQAALTTLWRELGVDPAHVVGHSAGEYAALWAAGAFSLEEGLHLAAVRGRLMREAAEEGALLAVLAGHGEVGDTLADHPEVEVAVVNGASHCVVGGPRAAVAAAGDALDRQGVATRWLEADRAFHTASMDPLLDAFEEHAHGVRLAPLDRPFSRNTDGARVEAGGTLGVDYLRRQIRETARFDLALGDAAAGGGTFLEVGPGATLTGIGRREHPELEFVASHTPAVSADQDIGEALARLHAGGAAVRWHRLAPAGAVRERPPAYPFQRGSYWPEPAQPDRTDDRGDTRGSPAPHTTGPPASGMDMTTYHEPEAEDPLFTNVVETVRERAAHHFGMEADQLGTGDAFVELGADSLGMVNMLRDIEQRFAVRVPMRELFETADTAHRLAGAVVERLTPEQAERITASSGGGADPARDAPAGGTAPADTPAEAGTAAAGAAPETAPPDRGAPPDPAVPAPPTTGTPAGGDTAEGIVNRQLGIIEQLSGVMSEQLALLRSGGTGRNPGHTADSPGTVPSPAPAEGTGGDPASATGAGPGPGTGASRGAGSDAAAEAPSAHGPRVSVPRDSGMVTGESAPEQQNHLRNLVRDYESSTRTSKDLAQRYRSALADSRSVVGFRGATKEMLYPLAADRASGAHLDDVDGNRYVDITMGFGILLFGHEPEFVTEAVQRHLSRGLRLGARNEETGEAAELLTRLTGTERAAFATSGTEANSAAIRLARAATGRDTVVMFSGSYHGHIDSVLAHSAPDGGGLRTFPVSTGIPDNAVRDVVVLEYGAEESLATIDQLGSDVAAVLVEPVQSRRPDRQPAEFLRRLREVTRRHGSVLLFDEMLTGFRPHPRGARGHFGVEPDLATYGKVIGGGFPIGAIAGPAAIMDGVDGGFWRYGDASHPQADTTFFGGTYAQHPLAMSAARAVLGHLEQHSPGLQDRLNDRTRHLADTLNAFFAEEEFPVHVARFGSQFRFEYRGNMELFFHHLLLNGVHVWEWRNFFLSTAHTDEDVAFVIDAVKESLRGMRRGGLLPAGSGTTAPAAKTAAAPAPSPGPAAEGGPAEEPSRPPVPEVEPRRTDVPDFSIYFFGDYPEDVSREDAYRMIQECARFGDENGFHAVWLPERHFHSFGGIFPNPSVLAAALASQTSRIRLNSGSVVLPLHNPIRVAEEWSLVDNLSNGRVGRLGCASGWHANDFVFFPERYGRHKAAMYEGIDTVRRLWRGGSVPGRSGSGDRVEVGLYPKPVQRDLPMSAAVVGNPDSYRMAAEHDLGVVTNLMAQSVEQLAENIELYRTTRAENGLDPGAGRVTVLVHTYLGDDAEQARAAAREPFCRYLRSSLSLFGQMTNSLGLSIDLENTPEEDVEFMLGMAFDRYCESRALIGTPDSCAPVVEALLDAGADEIAAFLDFGLPGEEVLAGLPALDALRRRYQDREDRPATGPARPAAASRTAVTDTAPLSFAQQRIWFLERMLPGRSTYKEVKAIDLDGPLDTNALRAAVQHMADRHPALRTVFHDTGGEPRQVVLGRVAVPCPVVERAGDSVESALREVTAEEGNHPFDLENGPLIRARLLRFSDTHHVLVLAMHHIVIDSLSALVLTRELSETYRASAEGRAPDLPELTTTYTRHAREQRAAVDGGSAEESLRYWTNQLAGPLPELRLPFDRPRPQVPVSPGGSLFHLLPRDLSERLREFSRGQRATLFTTLLAGLGEVLHRFSGQDDILVGTPVAGRPEGTGDLVGFFANTLALRLDLAGDPTFADLVTRTRTTLLDAQDHEDAPFEEVVRRVAPERDPGRTPVFQVMVEFENEPVFEFDLPGVEARLLNAGVEKAPFDLTLYLENRPEGVQCHLEYNTDVFDPATARRLLDYLHTTLDAAVAEPEAPLSATGGLTEGDRRFLLEHQARPAPPPEECLHQRVERQVAATPDATAVLSGDETWTYRELNAAANQLAHRLRAAGVRPDDSVGVLVSRSPRLVVALLAVAKAGGAYLPLDALLGGERLAFMLDDSGAGVLVTDQAGEAPMRIPDGVTVLDIPEAATVPDGADDSDPDCVTTPDNLLYCLYTSGSTGRPKGIAMPHRCLVALTDWYAANRTPMRTLQFASCGFDVASQEIFTALTTGGSLVLVSEEQRFDPRALAAVVRDQRVERVIVPFTPLRHLLEALSAEGPAPHLREVVNTAERLTITSPVRRFLTENPDCALFNEYGPTETHVVAAHRVTDLDDPVPPVGGPVADTTLRLLDPGGRPVPVGAVGEIHVSGSGVARGYVGRPEETGRAFGTDPFSSEPRRRMYRTGDLGRWRGDGTLEYLGREDDQTKIRGWRVEPGEVEHALNGTDPVRQAVVLVQDGGAEPYLAAYVTLTDDAGDGGTPAVRAELAAELHRTLPHYMVPTAWVFLPSLPMGVNGKVDRAALPPAAPERQDPPAPLSDAAERVRRVWESHLGVSGVHPDTSFFELGGHSLQAVALLNRIRDELGGEVSLTEFFRAPTVRGMAERLEQADPGTAAAPTAPGNRVEGTV
ncbi:amino acid adenylation domain-containing protein/natural product biosynthesis luciferase-like monooxygenase protein [Haloactinospora alba]|uniref:Amino acid adenylation domain-containing protein/natural product biosynthesis luciferase-like monooxygenase protein n=1 Tax=Haloactinospora alba TaxID=405555 RepID=A0A543N721_9ACTN|nr:non-ribosomal peptide synthetase/type I polyketide synthase [Haloactinospora alba]TQN27626.1 amino acid adenylation domain-containing protein/natural product biosynthesis luciferase-like monooxygenase protein [Haloactinospora alba]